MSTTSNESVKYSPDENVLSKSSTTIGDLPRENGDEDERMWAAISFVVILIIFGVPLWWKMTEVERSFFPYNEIADLQSRDIIFPLHIDVKTSTLSSENLVNDLQNLFLQSSLFKIKLHTEPSPFMNKTISELEEMKEIHPHLPGYYQLIEIVSPRIENDIAVGKHRTIYITQKCNAEKIYTFFREIILNEKLLLESMKTVTSPGIMSENTYYLRKVRPSPKYDIIFSVVNPQPEVVNFQWDNELHIERYFQPFLQKLFLLSDFHVKSQWLYLLDWHQIPKKVNDRYELNHLQIPHIITPLEKKIGSGVAQNPCINFVLFVTKCDYAPTTFVNEEGKTSNAILSARWGAVQLVNPNSTNCKEHIPMTVNDRAVMQIFIVQFKILLGLHDWSSRKNMVLNDNSIDIYSWEIDSLYRMRILEQFISSRITLISLSQLLGEISNIVITDEVGDAVMKSVTAVGSTLNALAEGRLSEALKFSTQSFVASEFAFTHPSLLALLYFPDDQKYAVYIPLYLPVMIPVLLSLKNILSWLRKKRTNNGGCKKND